MVEIKQDMPQGWPSGHQYGKTCVCKAMAGQKRMKYIQPERPLSYKPQKLFRPPEVKMPEGTTYKLSYEAFDPKMIRTCRGIPTIVKENLMSAGEFSGDTTHKMSYNAWPELKREAPFAPSDHKLTGDGPMQELTTHRHDYTPKPIDSVEKIIHQPTLGLSTAPMENNSTMSMSYKCPDYNRFEPAASFKPHSRYMPPDSPVEANTIQKLSYLPWEPEQKSNLPWAKKNSYRPPEVPLDTGTIYSGSFIAPGRLVEDDKGHCKGCYCLYPAECLDSQGEPPEAKTCPPSFNPATDPPRPGPMIDPHL